MLEQVSLTPAEADRRVRDYSLGMRQRLGIATALLGDPEVLILDEPANGLDPAGIRWMRDLLRGYADLGGTVLLSSHLLHEIEVVADDLVVIGNGRIVAQGTKAELLASAGTLVRTRTSPRVAGPDGARRRARPERRSRRRRTPCASRPSPVSSARSPSRRASPLLELRPAEGAGLEEMFLELTADDQRETTREGSTAGESSMSTIDPAVPDAAPPRRTPPVPAPIPFGRLVSVELRKSVDTRAGFWLLACSASSACSPRSRCCCGPPTPS